jgi:hypothetical protein
MKNTNSNSKYMHIDVILTFNTQDKNGETQEFFNLNIPVSKKEVSAANFMHTKFFKRVAKKIVLLNREAGELVKISTASDWGKFEGITGLDSLCTLGHSCKWFFGNGREDLDAWEEVLISEYGFGTNADMSYVNNPETKALIANYYASNVQAS